MQIPQIEPFQFIRSTAFSERVQLANKINEIIDGINSLGEIPDLQTQIDAINSEISEIQTAIEDTNSDVSTLSNQVNTLVSEVNGLLKEVVTEVVLDAPEYGQVRVKVIHEDETETASNALQIPVIVDGGISLISGTTTRSFKIRYITADGVTHTTNDFVIPEGGGGTDVTVTSVTILEGDSDNSFKFEVGLSDGSTIQSNSYPIQQAAITPATTSQIGGIKVGANLSVTADGTLSVDMTTIGTAAKADTIMWTADASKVTLHADSLNGSDFTEDIPQASQSGAGTIDAASYQKLQNMPAPDTVATDSDVQNVQNNVNTLEQSVEDLKEGMLTDPAQVIQVASAEHDGIIRKEDYSKIGSTIIATTEYGFNFTPISSTITSNPSTFIKKNQDFGLDSDSDSHKLILTNTNSLIRGVFKTGILLKDSGMTHYNTPNTSFQPITCLFYTDTIITSTDRINAVFTHEGKNYLLRTLSSNFTRNKSNDLSFNGKTYYCYNVTLDGKRGVYGIYAENPSDLNLPTTGTIVNLVLTIPGAHSFACTSKPTVTEIPSGSLIFEPSM